MLTGRIAIILICFVVFTKTVETFSNETFSQDVASGSGTVVNQVSFTCRVICDGPFY